MAYGLQPVYHLTGGTIRPREYTIASAYDTGIWTGDVLELETTGVLVAGDNAGEPNLIGVFGGCEYTNAQGEVIFNRQWPADQVATNIKAYVYDDPNIVFRIESDQVATGVVAADVGENFDYVYAAGNTTTGTSGSFLDSSATIAPTAALNFRIIGSGQQDGDFTAVGTPMNVLIRFKSIYIVIRSVSNS